MSEIAIDSVSSTPSHCATSGVSANTRMTANPTTRNRRPRSVVATTVARTSHAAIETSHCAYEAETPVDPGRSFQKSGRPGVFSACPAQKSPFSTDIEVICS